MRLMKKAPRQMRQAAEHEELVAERIVEQGFGITGIHHVDEAHDDHREAG